MRTSPPAVRATVVAALLVAVPSLVLAGCGDDGDGKVDVTLSEFIVQPEPASVDAGNVEFVGDNVGAETHELVVVRAASADALPRDADGAVDEDRLPAGALIGEIEDIGSASSKSVELELAAGSYVLFCNIVEQEDGRSESHFAEGMHSPFTVR
jgi:hypothetical protein